MQYPYSLVVLSLTFFLSVSASPISLANLVTSSVEPSTQFASNRVTLPLARRVNATGSSKKLLRFDQARAQALHQRAQANSNPDPSSPVSSMFEAPATNGVVSYVTPVVIGTPPTTYSLLIDTGSSNTWIGAGETPYASISARPTGDLEAVTYGSGSFSGVEVIDAVTLAGNLTIPKQSIAVSFKNTGFDGVDGILGIGPQNLTIGSSTTNPNKTIPTVTDSAWTLGLMDDYEVGISFHPYDYSSMASGELTFGGVDPTKFNDHLNYVPITKKYPASQFVGIDQEISYGKQGTVLYPTAGILDTGTTLILLATDAFQRYQEYTGGVPDNSTGLLRLTREQYENLESLIFRIGQTEYELTPNAQIWPRVLNEEIGGDADGIYLIVNDFGSPSGQGLDFINGMSFLERFYMVYDVGGNNAGLATTPYTYAETN